MCTIIQFDPNYMSQRMLNKFRTEALAKGQVDTYICNNCGEEFDVYYDKKPDFCPGCKRLLNYD